MKAHHQDQLSLFMTETNAEVSPAVHIANSLEPSDIEALRCSTDQPSESQPEGTVELPECEWSTFSREHSRVPMIGDERKPWQYRGWLLYYRLLLEEHPEIGGRWDYWSRTMINGRLLDEPIPQVTFAVAPNRAVLSNFERWVHTVDHHFQGWSAVDKLIDWFLWGLGISKEQPEFSLQLSEALYRDVDIGPMLLTPHDYIGEWIAGQKGKWNPNAFYPTPHPVVEVMVRMTMGEDNDARCKKVCDPCVGSGRMLLHASNHSLRLYGVDIDRTLVKVTLINGALYAPWLIRPFPEHFFAGES
jgi:hypothetical protein